MVDCFAMISSGKQGEFVCVVGWGNRTLFVTRGRRDAMVEVRRNGEETEAPLVLFVVPMLGARVGGSFDRFLDPCDWCFPSPRNVKNTRENKYVM